MKKMIANRPDHGWAFAVAAPAFAQAPQAAPVDPATTAAARELFESMNYREMMTGLMKQMSRSAVSSMRPRRWTRRSKATPSSMPAAKKQAREKLERKLPEIDKIMNEFHERSDLGR